MNPTVAATRNVAVEPLKLSQPVKYHNRRQHTGRLISIKLQSNIDTRAFLKRTQIFVNCALMYMRRNLYIGFSSNLECSVMQSYFSPGKRYKTCVLLSIHGLAINSSLENSP